MLTYPEDLCIDCGNARLVKDAKGTEVFKHLFGTRNLPLICVEPLVRYLKPMPDADAEFRRLYLRPMLLGPRIDPRSPFRKLTYFSNGEAASISCYEDVIDRVLKFVCG